VVKSKATEWTVLLPKEALEQGTRWVKVPSANVMLNGSQQ